MERGNLCKGDLACKAVALGREKEGRNLTTSSCQGVKGSDCGRGATTAGFSLEDDTVKCE